MAFLSLQARQLLKRHTNVCPIIHTDDADVMDSCISKTKGAASVPFIGTEDCARLQLWAMFGALKGPRGWCH